MHVRPVSAERRFAAFLTLMTLLVIGSVSTTHAQLPGTLSYQGQILEDDGRPVADGLHRLDLSIYGDAFGSELLWQESHVTEFRDGLFSIYLGSINPLNLPFDRQYWLGVSFDGNDEMTERTPLSSSPYAVRSQIAGDLDGGAVRSINGQQGALQIVGTGSTVVTERNGTITIGMTLPKSLMGDGKIDLTPVDAQIATDGYTLININDLSGSDSDLIDLQVDSSDVFLLESNGDLTTTGMVTGVGASFSNERVQNVADPTAAQDAATKNYVDAREVAIEADLMAYADQAEADAQAYSDAQDVTQTTDLQAYADQAEADAKAYSDAQDAAQNTTGEPFITFAAGTTKLTDNRVLAAGTGVSITDAAVDNGSMTVAIGQDVAATASPTFSGATLTNVSPNSSSTDVLVSNGGDVESRSANSLAPEFYDNFWRTDGNSGSTPGTDYIGTSDNAPLHIYVDGGNANSLILNTDGSVQRGTDGEVRGNFATDMQAARTGTTQVASGNYSTIGGGQNSTASGAASTVGGGVGNVASATWSTVSGGSINRATGWGTAVGGGRANHADGNGSSIAGGVYNNALGLYTAIPGGRDLTLSGSGSFGFLSGVNQSANNTNPGTRPMSVSANDIALFGNTDMWLANNDGASSQLRFYEANGTTGPFPNGTNYTSFEAGAQSADINYTLPTSAPAADGHVLSSTAAGAMSWVDPTVVANAWNLDGNAGTSAGTDYIGTRDEQALHLYVNDGSDNSLILNTNGSVQRDAGGNARGIDAVDLQSTRSSADQAGTGDYSVIGGGLNNTASGIYTSVGGGTGNRATTYGSRVGGGDRNNATDSYSSVGGGFRNNASGFASSTVGGYSNKAEDSYATVGGGLSNRASGYGSSVAGGSDNLASGLYGNVAGGAANTASSISSVGGGYGNTASASYSIVGGGLQNTSSGEYSTVVGGSGNTVSGDYSTLLGSRGLELSGNGSLGFLGSNNDGSKNMRVAASNTAVLGNVDLWLANNDGTARQLRFYEPEGSTGAFPSGTNYTALRARGQSTDVVYTLPGGAPSSSGQVLTSNTSGDWSWSNSLTLASMTSTDATITNLTADTVEGDVADFSNSSSTTPTLTLDNSGSGGIAIDISKGGVQLGYLEYTALNENKADNAGGYPRISSSVALAVVTATDGNNGPYSVRVPASGVNGQILYVINASGSKIKLRDTKEGAIDVNDDRGVSVIYYGSGWRVIALQSGGGDF